MSGINIREGGGKLSSPRLENRDGELAGLRALNVQQSRPLFQSQSSAEADSREHRNRTIVIGFFLLHRFFSPPFFLQISFYGYFFSLDTATDGRRNKMQRERNEQ